MDAQTQPQWTFTPQNPYQINSVALDYNGDRCVFGTSSEYGQGDFAFYCCDGRGNALWSEPLSPSATQGFFWACISDNGDYAAGGGQYSEDSGFLKAYDCHTGKVMLDVSLPGRVNQVSMNHDGRYLVAVFSDTVQLYRREEDQYALRSSQALNAEELSFYGNSAVIATDGNTVVVSGRNYDQDKGYVFVFDIEDEKLAHLRGCLVDTASMRVAVSHHGQFWAAVLHDGSCVLFSRDDPATPFARCQPTLAGLGIGYGLDLVCTEQNQVLAACGVNISNSDDQGLLYVVKSDGKTASLAWQAPLTYPANPGISLDRAGRFVTATDGAPEGKEESAGHFYLFDAQNGAALWRYQTSLMNWPMMITGSGKRILGGSDDGLAYYWHNE
ncbi:WD40 repeat domain-containing protein [Gallaecimonas mangrovi]|uniref:hypothetical protein n=1 Tax=Gallaecimonas mangrovi TaxID=2291597 RepID=UPI000E20C6B1|nr:hypothetical protein [Gallaecimonas mangrovi]